MSLYFPHTGYADHHVENHTEQLRNSLNPRKTSKLWMETSTLNMVLVLILNATVLASARSMIRTSVETGWCNGWWCRNSSRSTPFRKNNWQKVTYRTPKGAEKQLDYIFINRKYLKYSGNAGANDMIHMGSDHRCVMARLVIPAKTKKKPLLNGTTPKRTLGRTGCDERVER